MLGNYVEIEHNQQNQTKYFKANRQTPSKQSIHTSIHFTYSDLHAISDYKKRLYKKQPVEFKETKKPRLVTIYKAKKRNSKKCL